MARTTKRISDRRERAGFTLIELLVATTILAIGVMGVMGMYAVTYNITMRAEDTSVSYNVSKRVIESIRAPGFTATPEGTVTTYYDINGNLVGAPPPQGFQVDVNVVSASQEVSLSTSRPAHDALRTASITMTAIPSGDVLINSATYLVYGGS